MKNKLQYKFLEKKCLFSSFNGHIKMFIEKKKYIHYQLLDKDHGDHDLRKHTFFLVIVKSCNWAV